jgi:hypothetical protein
LCTGGIIHIVDEVLAFPPVVPVLITQAKLKFFISILQTGSFITTTSEGLANEVRLKADVTVFTPNSAGALVTFNAIKAKNPTQEQLAALFNYHIVQNFVGYSTALQNGTRLQSLNGKKAHNHETWEYYVRQWSEGHHFGLSHIK